jgi:hypothetical protein
MKRAIFLLRTTIYLVDPHAHTRCHNHTEKLSCRSDKTDIPWAYALISSAIVLKICSLTAENHRTSHSFPSSYQTPWSDKKTPMPLRDSNHLIVLHDHTVCCGWTERSVCRREGLGRTLYLLNLYGHISYFELMYCPWDQRDIHYISKTSDLISRDIRYFNIMVRLLSRWDTGRNSTEKDKANSFHWVFWLSAIANSVSKRKFCPHAS